MTNPVESQQELQWGNSMSQTQAWQFSNSSNQSMFGLKLSIKHSLGKQFATLESANWKDNFIPQTPQTYSKLSNSPNFEKWRRSCRQYKIRGVWILDNSRSSSLYTASFINHIICSSSCSFLQACLWSLGSGP